MVNSDKYFAFGGGDFLTGSGLTAFEKYDIIIIVKTGS